MSELNGRWAQDSFAVRMATEQAVAERNASLPLEEQQAAFNRLNVHVSAHGFHQAGPHAPPKLEFYQAAELYNKHLERTEMIVQRMVPCGLTVLAGAPKRGKSWLALALGLAVASGSDFLGQKTQQGSVLYLDLESRQYLV